MIKRLRDNSGVVLDQPVEQKGASDGQIMRRGILVHAGANGAPVTFHGMNGDIKFDAARIKNVVKSHNAKMNQLATDYGGIDQMPAGAFPPLLDHHEDDGNDRVIGKLLPGLQFEVRKVPGVGDNVPCVTGQILFLGKDTVERVKDGRLYHLSVGINEDDDTLSELSTVISPAAPGAMLLKKRTAKPGGQSRMAILAKRKIKLAQKQKVILSSLKSMQSMVDERLKKVKLAQRKKAVASQFANALASGKLSPAEFKKISLKRAANLSDEALKFVDSILEAREPIVDVRQLGSAQATSITKIAKELKTDGSEAIQKNLSSVIDNKFNLKKADASSSEKSGPFSLANEVVAKLSSLKSENEKKLATIDAGILAPNMQPDLNESTVERGEIDQLKSAFQEMQIQLAKVMQVVADQMNDEDDEDDSELEEFDDSEDEDSEESTMSESDDESEDGDSTDEDEKDEEDKKKDLSESEESDEDKKLASDEDEKEEKSEDDKKKDEKSS